MSSRKTRTIRKSRYVSRCKTVATHAFAEEVEASAFRASRELDNLARLSAFAEKLPEVMALWFAEAEYLNESGRPLPLPLEGQGPSLGTLIRRVFPDPDVKEVADVLLQCGSVRKKGARFFALRQNVVFVPHLAQAHLFAAARRYVVTVQHNQACRDPDQRLFERFSSVPHIPRDALPTIHAQIKKEMGEAVMRMDAYLRGFQVPADSQDTTTVFVESYAAEDPFMTSTEPGSEDGDL
jgi:hypothetical protein